MKKIKIGLLAEGIFIIGQYVQEKKQHGLKNCFGLHLRKKTQKEIEESGGNPLDPGIAVSLVALMYPFHSNPVHFVDDVKIISYAEAHQNLQEKYRDTFAQFVNRPKTPVLTPDQEAEAKAKLQELLEKRATGG